MQPISPFKLPLLVQVGLLAFGSFLTSCTENDGAPEHQQAGGTVCDESAVREVVHRFGDRMKLVSLQSPDSILVSAIEDAYAELVTPALLQQWTSHPASAPGRDLSSPWPERIEVHSVETLDHGACSVTGELIYLTSAEVARGGIAARTPVRIQVVQQEIWRISNFQKDSSHIDTLSAVPSSDSTLATSLPIALDSSDSRRIIPPADAPSASEDAVPVIHRYFQAIDAREYASAYAQWGDGGAASGQSFEEFVTGFAETAHVDVEIGTPGQVEGAAGSRFVEIPVVIYAVDMNGEEQRFEGSYVLRRSIVDGATPEQRRWHIYSATIARTD